MTRASALALIAAVSMYGCRQPDKARPVVTPVKVVVAGPAGAAGARAIQPRCFPCLESISAFKVPGYVAEITPIADGADAGGRCRQATACKRGEVLARLRSGDYDVKVDEARSQQAEVEAALAQAKQAFDRAQGLYQRKSLTRTITMRQKRPTTRCWPDAPVPRRSRPKRRMLAATRRCEAR